MLTIERVLLPRRELQRYYAKTFLGPDDKPHANAVKVLADLRRYCGVDHEGIAISPVTRTTDPFATVYRAGKRDVYLLIERMLTANYQEKDIDDRGNGDE